MHVISQIIDGGATEADGGANAPVCPTVAMPLSSTMRKQTHVSNENIRIQRR